jgi:hypothetical protein
MLLMVWLGDGTQVIACFSRFGDSANLDAGLVHGLRQMHHRLRKSFWTHPMVVLGDEALVEARFCPFGDSAHLAQDRCTVCAKCTIGSKSFSTHLMELLGDVCHVESRFRLFGDSVSVGVR